jgi:hypothetical protein
LMSTDFKNFAIGCVYDSHQTDSVRTEVTTMVFTYVFDNTLEGAKLRCFYIHFEISNFWNTHKIPGTTEEWDGVMMDFDELRMAFLTMLRTMSRAGTKESYMKTTPLSNPNDAVGRGISPKGGPGTVNLHRS